MKSRILYWSARAWRSSILFASVGAILRVGAQLALLPAILFYLTPKDQALWWVFVALGNFANLADFGFAQAIVRIYNYLWAGADDFEEQGLPGTVQRAEPNIDGVITLNHTVQHLYWRLSLGATFFLAVGGTLYLSKTVSPTTVPHLWYLWAAYVLAVGFNFSTSYWLLACQGINRVREVQLAYVWSSLTFLLSVMILLKLGLGLAAIVIGTAARGIVLRQVGRATLFKVIPNLSQNKKPDFKILRKIWPNARRFGLLSITGYWAANGLVLMSGYFLGPEMTASVGATNTAGNFVLNFAGMWLNVKWPEITMMRTQGKLEAMSRLFARRLGMALATFILLASVIAVAGNALLEWKGSRTHLIPLRFLTIYFAYLLQQFIYIQFATLVFTENIVPFCRISVLTGFAMITLSIFLVPWLGLWGLLLGPFLAESLFTAWVVVRRGFSSQSMALHQFCRFALSGRA
jgi:O-antigen/teichoic acid export membrane protein